jgi:hypothetical protein
MNPRFTPLRRAALLASFALALAIGTTQSAAAATAEDCQALLTQLGADTTAASPSFSNQKDVTGLVAKVDLASTELSLGDTDDAASKLGDYRTKLAALATAPKPKVEPTVAAGLEATSQQAVDCISSIAP